MYVSAVSQDVHVSSRLLRNQLVDVEYVQESSTSVKQPATNDDSPGMSHQVRYHRILKMF